MVSMCRARIYGIHYTHTTHIYIYIDNAYRSCIIQCHGFNPPGLLRFRLFLSNKNDKSKGSFLFGIFCNSPIKILFNRLLCSSL